MAKPKKATGPGASGLVAVDGPPKGAMRVLVRVRRTGRTMRVSIGEARALVAIKAVEYVAEAPPPKQVPAPKPPTYQRRDMVAAAPVADPTLPSVQPMIVKSEDGQA